MDISEQLKYLDDLIEMDTPHIESLIEYTTSTGYSINESLRNGTGRYNKIISDIDTIFNGCPPLKVPILVYRSIDEYFNFSYKSEGYVSTSTTLTTAGTGGGCCLLRITIPAGTKVLPLMNISNNSSENEILLSRDSSLKFTFESKEIVDDEEYIVIDMVLLQDHESANINYIASIIQKDIEMLENIYTESDLEDLIQSSKDLEQDYDKFVISLRVEISYFADRLNLPNLVKNIFLKKILKKVSRIMYNSDLPYRNY